MEKIIIEIDGIGEVEVDASFRDLTTAEQNAFVQNISREAQGGTVVAEDEAPSAPVEKQQLRSVAQGALLGFADELEAAVFHNPFSTLGKALGLSKGTSYKERLQIIRDKLASYRSENPLESMAYEFGGAVLPAVAAGLFTAGTGTTAVGASTAARLAPTALRAAKIGAAEGAVAGFGAGEGGFSERAKSAATGAALGGTVGAVAPVAVQQVGRLGRGALDAVGIGGKKRASTFSERKMLEALERDGLTPNEAMARLDEARSLGVSDITPADLGENLRGAAWRAQATPNPSRQGVLEQFSQRQSGQAEQISEQTAEMANVKGPTGISYLDDLAERVQRQADPAYKAAYSIDLDAKPFAAMAQSKVIQDAYNKAVDIADIDPDIDITGMPKDLGDFFGQAALRGEKISMPTEVAHTIKKGLDNLIESETDTLTGKVTQRGRVLTKLKKSWNSEISSQNDVYKAANSQFADNSALRKAYETGFDFNKMPEKVLAKKVASMTASEKEALRVGLISQVEEMASRTGDATDFVKTIFGSPRRRAALRLSFDDAKQFERFEKMIKAQSDKMRTQRSVFGGSDTAQRLLQQEDAGVDPSSIYGIGTRAALGDVTGAVGMAGAQAVSRIKGFNEKNAEELSRMLFSADPRTQRQILDALKQRELVDTASRRRLTRRPEVYSGALGAMGGLLAGRSEQ